MGRAEVKRDAVLRESRVELASVKEQQAAGVRGEGRGRILSNLFTADADHERQTAREEPMAGKFWTLEKVAGKGRAQVEEKRVKREQA